MKKLLLSILISTPVLAFAQQGEFTLNGKIGTLNAPAKAYLNYVANGKQVMDSALITNGAFTFKGMITEPAKARIIIDQKGEGLKKLSGRTDLVIMYLEPTVISITAKDSVKNAAFTGSKLNTDYVAFLKSISVQVAEIKAVNVEYSNAPEFKRTEADFKNAMQERFNKANTSIKDLQMAFIKANPDSYYSLIALTESMQSGMDINKIEPLYKGLSAKVRAMPGAATLTKAIAAVHATSVNAMAPDFTQNDVNDQPVKLSSLRGKYVLLDFWASWCVPCREENPNVVAAYNKFKDKNFTVLGVSLDQPGKKDLWLAAIAKDGLAWTQVSDLKFWKNEVALLYGIKGIPQNFLIDPTGKIVATNLRGDALQAKLAELIK